MKNANNTLVQIPFIIMAMMTAGNTQAQIAELGKYANVNGIKMYYEIHGAGKPLVLIHGGGSTINTSFSRILPTLAKTHQVIALELQAHGHTSDRNSPESFEQDADDVAELLKQLNIAKADIFGFSNGGHTALELAIRHPGQVNKLIIASAFYKRDGVPSGFWDGFKNPRFSDMPQVYKDEFLKINNDQTALMNMFNKDAKRMLVFKDWPEEAIRSIQAPALIVIGDRAFQAPNTPQKWRVCYRMAGWPYYLVATVNILAKCTFRIREARYQNSLPPCLTNFWRLLHLKITSYNQYSIKSLKPYQHVISSLS